MKIFVQRAIIALAFFCASVFSAPPAAHALEAVSRSGLRLEVGADGRYAVAWPEPGWIWSGKINGAPGRLIEASGNDALGNFREFSWLGKTEYQIKIYLQEPILIFSETLKNHPARELRFPEFNRQSHRFIARITRNPADNAAADAKLSIE